MTRRTLRTETTDARCRNSAPSAFSLIELIVVVAVTAILAAIAVPRFGNSISIHRADSAAKRIVADLTLAQRRGKMTSAAQRVVFTPGSGTYELIGLADMDHSAQAYVVSLAGPPYEAVIVSANFGGDSEVIFDGYGAPDSGGTVIIRVADSLRQIDLDADTGKAVKQ